MRLSELRPLGAVGLLRPELAAAALERLLSATVGETEGRVVFSHSSTEGEIRKKDKFGKFFAARIGEGMDCVMFRERLERAADSRARAEEAKQGSGGTSQGRRRRSEKEKEKKHSKPQKQERLLSRRRKQEEELQGKAGGGP